MKYLVRIVTHAKRGAGTTAAVRLYRLTGTEGSEGPFPWMKDGFLSGSTFLTSVETKKKLGRLKVLEIGHDGVGDAGTGWLLSGVGVLSEEENDIDEAWFPFGKWLGESDAQDGASGPIRVTLTRQEENTTVHTTSKQKSPSLKHIDIAAFAIPEFNKVRSGKRAKVSRNEGYAGEDAYFVNNTSFGVADGVSEWLEIGVDSGYFSRALMKGASKTGTIEGAAQAAREFQGSSTIALVNVDLKQSKCFCNVLGDSQVALCRNGKIIERSIEQEHSFGVPFQLSSEEGRDQPKDALKYEWNLKPNDILICGTDGLFDNLGDEDMTKIIENTNGPTKTCSQKAIELALKAFDVSQMKHGETPYSRAASEAFNLAFSGGKMDDVTVIVAKVT